MLYLFGIAVFFLVGLVVVRRMEMQRGRDVLPQVRDTLDVWVLKLYRGVRRVFRSVQEFVRRDLVLHGLHLLSYVALVCVRWLEQRLARAVFFFRGRGRKVRSHTEVSAHHSMHTTQEGRDTRVPD